MLTKRKIIAIDLDILCQGGASVDLLERQADILTDGAVQFLEALGDYRVVVYSPKIGQKAGFFRRRPGEAEVKEWLKAALLELLRGRMPERFADWRKIVDRIEVSDTIPLGAHAVLTDKAITFNGFWPKVEGLEEFKPWSKR